MKSLKPGVYVIRIESPGFHNFAKQISIATREEYHFTATMDVGGTNMGVIVTVLEEVPPKQPALDLPYTSPKVPPLIFPPAK